MLIMRYNRYVKIMLIMRCSRNLLILMVRLWSMMGKVVMATDG